MLKMVIANPTEDQFNYFLFETIALVLTKTNRFEANLHSYFSKAIRANLLIPIQNTVTDLMSYVFQIFTVELNIASETELASEPLYTNLLESILYQHTNWSLSMKYLFKPFIAYIKVSFMRLKNFYLNKPQNINQTFVIVNSLLGLKHYQLGFDLLDSTMNFFDFNFIFENIKSVVYNLVLIHKNIKETNMKAYREFSKLLIVFLSKLLIKTNSKLLIEILEGISSGLTVSLLAELCEFLIDLDSNKNKKLVTYAYCQIINDYYSAFGIDTLRLFTWKLIQHLEKFYKINLNSYGAIEKLFDSQDFSYSANNYNKLHNADISVNYL
jgi:exportin-2 (importin alpha re-exporter)